MRHSGVLEFSFSPWAADGTTLTIMVQFLEGRIVEPAHFAFIGVCALAQYLLIMEDYLTIYCPTCPKRILVTIQLL